MKRSGMTNLEKVNTKYLKQFVDNGGITDHGSDLDGALIEQVEAVLWERARLQDDKHLAKSHKQAACEDDQRNRTKTCTTCGIAYPIKNIDAHFYAVSGKPGQYRQTCKPCRIKSALSNKQTFSEIPF